LSRVASVAIMRIFEFISNKFSVDGIYTSNSMENNSFNLLKYLATAES
jgi:hypothetical protein